VVAVAGGDVVIDGDAGALQPEAVAAVAEVVDGALVVLAELPVVRQAARPRRTQREVVPERPDLVAHLGDEAGAEHVVGDAVLDLDVAVVVDVPHPGLPWTTQPRTRRGSAVVSIPVRWK